jgi:Na+-transporting methylmalonyl-CoA/oxaloacetate decarboxylase beta subunit
MVQVIIPAKKWGILKLALIMIILLGLPAFSAAEEDTGIDYYATLQKKLIHDKINPQLVEKIYSSDNI